MLFALASCCAASTAHLPQHALARLTSGLGYAVVPNFVSDGTVALFREDVAQLRGDGRFSVAAVGDPWSHSVAEAVRRCEQYFLYPREKCAGEGHEGREQLYAVIDGVRKSLQQATGHQLSCIEGLYAYYPSGGYYRKHVDNPPTSSRARRFSYLLYCNDNWRAEDGGCLRLYPRSGRGIIGRGASLAAAHRAALRELARDEESWAAYQKDPSVLLAWLERRGKSGLGETESPSSEHVDFVDIEPRAGTLVVFRSTLEHEVLDTRSPRLAVVGWFGEPFEADRASAS